MGQYCVLFWVFFSISLTLKLIAASEGVAESISSLKCKPLLEVAKEERAQKCSFLSLNMPFSYSDSL